MFKKFFVIGVLSVLSVNVYATLSSSTVCNDGTWSSSKGSGTCSHHGGVRR